jgi:hypothetical protein
MIFPRMNDPIVRHAKIDTGKVNPLLKFTSLACALVLLTACEVPQAPNAIADTTIDDSFPEFSLDWENGQSLVYRVGIFETDGTYDICSAAQNIRSGQDRQALNALKVTVNGQTLMRGLEWARIYPDRDVLDGKAAACRATDVRVVANARFDVELTKTSIVRDRF